MVVRHRFTSLRSPLALTLAAALLPATAFAQSQAPADATAPQAKELDKVVVTGSLIPQTQVETFVPVTIISAEDIQARGFNNVAEVLQKSSFATGGVQNSQTSGGFTQGAETLSLFGLSASYVKYLIDGRPMANYPALYNGSDVFNNISGIPVELVERIEILPGGQSSLYGSDAIAGVVNIILKKNMEGSVVSGRIGGFDEGGGKSGRVSFATSVSSADNRWTTLLGVQAEKVDPVWGSQRDLTRQFNLNARNGDAPVASRDWAIFDVDNYNSYIFLDPANCANLGSAFGGTEGKQSRAGKGDYCGSQWTPGYRTLKNSMESAQVYAHSTFELNDLAQAYADVLLSHEKVEYNSGSDSLWWGTEVGFGAYYDPNQGKLLNLQRAFAPEEVGNWNDHNARNNSSSYSVTFGVNGTLREDSNWDYDISLTRTEYKLTETSQALLAGKVDAYFLDRVLGAQQGFDPVDGAFPVFTPDYAAFYKLMTPEDFTSISTFVRSHSRTYDNMLRAQFTNGALFSLPGGDAGAAIAVEAGTQGWRYDPDPLLLNGKIWGTTAVSGHGQRSRYSLTGEMRLPVWEPLTISASARYDGFRAAGDTIGKPTYSLGIEYRPVESLLLRGKYGTAFKAPTLADQFQGISGFYSSTVDYYNCALLGFDASNVQHCPARFSDLQYKGTSSGNKDLNPINATVWSYGVVWAPSAKFSASLDYHHWDIRDEVANQNVGQLMRDESDCRRGLLDINSGSCVAALSQITRGPNGVVQGIFVKKVNVANETLNALTLDLNYRQDLGAYGALNLAGSWTRNLDHRFQQYPTDPVVDYLRNPYYSTDPKNKATASASWNKDRWTTTLYANYLGRTPNYRGTTDKDKGYGNPGAGRLGSYTTFNGSVNFDVSDSLKVSFLVNNIANRMPDMDVNSYPGNSDEPYNSYNFDVLGRAYYLEAKWSFGKK
ncbi:TonB-dependent receptor plug domain-containing protein [Thermomonas sp.]|uniref:TonB-dependent receptor plug domain-containing protein n=1 Tax=Thermomonas sp. TaxID=1971895 RepID=UPI0035B0FC00